MTLLACKVVEKTLTKKCYGITEGWTDRRTDGRTDRCKPVYPPLFQSGGIKIILFFTSMVPTVSLLIWGLLLKERICSPREQILSFKSSPNEEGDGLR